MAPINPSAPSTSSTVLSANFLECLPTELRQAVYALLGYPVGTHIWVDCPGPPHCTRKAHDIFHDEAKWPNTWHAFPGGFEVREKIEKLIFCRGRGRGSFANLRVVYKLGDEEIDEKMMAVGLGLLGVNKTIRNELLHMLFGNVAVEFEYPLCYDAGYPPNFKQSTRPFTLQPPTLSYITHLTVIGASNDCDLAARTPIQHDTTSLSFIAAHCTNLQKLTYVVAEDICAEKHLSKDSKWHTDMDDMAQAFLAVAVSCTELKDLRIKWCNDIDDGSNPMLVKDVSWEGEQGDVVQWVRGVMVEALRTMSDGAQGS